MTGTSGGSLMLIVLPLPPCVLRVGYPSCWYRRSDMYETAIHPSTGYRIIRFDRLRTLSRDGCLRYSKARTVSVCLLFSCKAELVVIFHFPIHCSSP